MASIGSLKPLLTMLREAPTLAGVSVVFGMENVPAQEFNLPMVVVVPRGGQYAPGQGYVKDADVNLAVIWGVNTSIDLYLWAKSGDPIGQPEDEADAIENLRAVVLQAFQYQRPNGLFYFPV